MKRMCALFLILAVALSLCSCGKKSGGGGVPAAEKDAEIDALGAFTGEAEAVYAVRSLDGPENVWLADSFAVLNGQVYFAGHFLEESRLYRAERDGSNVQQMQAAAPASMYPRRLGILISGV